MTARHPEPIGGRQAQQFPPAGLVWPVMLIISLLYFAPDELEPIGPAPGQEEP